MAKKGIVTHVVAEPLVFTTEAIALVFTTEAIATDVLTGNFVITQRNDDTGTFQDTHTYVFAKALTDSSSISEAHFFDMVRPLADGMTLSDGSVYHFTKALTDTMSVTDDLDGQASVEDDQNMNFIKSRRDAGTFSEIVTRSFGGSYSDVATTSELGYIRGQSYSDFSYFSEDFVGFSQSF